MPSLASRHWCASGGRENYFPPHLLLTHFMHEFGAKGAGLQGLFITSTCDCKKEKATAASRLSNSLFLNIKFKSYR
jgi:hypothetical protein